MKQKESRCSFDFSLRGYPHRRVLTASPIPTHHGSDGEDGQERDDPVGGGDTKDDERRQQGESDALESFLDYLLLRIVIHVQGSARSAYRCRSMPTKSENNRSDREELRSSTYRIENDNKWKTIT